MRSAFQHTLRIDRPETGNRKLWDGGHQSQNSHLTNTLLHLRSTTVTQKSISTLQRVESSAARVVTRTSQHACPEAASLLPVKSAIHFKYSSIHVRHTSLSVPSSRLDPGIPPRHHPTYLRPPTPYKSSMIFLSATLIIVYSSRFYACFICCTCVLGCFKGAFK